MTDVQSTADAAEISSASADESAPQHSINRRRMFIAGAGIAGAAVVAKASTASAVDGGSFTGPTPTTYTNDSAPALPQTPGTPGGEAIVGIITGVNNGSHAIRGRTDGIGHAVAGVNTVRDNTRGATWGRHLGIGPGVEGENEAENVPIAGAANGVKGIVNKATNGSHAVLGVTIGDGHGVAGVASKLDNARGATWGRHLGAGAGIEGENTAENIPLAGPAHGALGIVTKATNGSHAVLGKTLGAGHSIAGDTPAEAQNGTGGPNTTAATWGRHQGIGAGIGGISLGGYGGEFKGATASVRLIPGDTPPAEAPTETTRKVGELLVDAAGNLWYNVADGANFTRLNDQGGITMLTNPQRAYESREEFPVPANTNKGRHGANEVRTINLAEFTDFPVGATGAIINLTVADTAAQGFATVFNGDTADADVPLASSINYVEAGMFVANGIIVPVGVDGTVKVFTLTPTEVIIDVVGSISGPRVAAPAA